VGIAAAAPTQLKGSSKISLAKLPANLNRSLALPKPSAFSNALCNLV
jgi:hypothetical protein